MDELVLVVLTLDLVHHFGPVFDGGLQAAFMASALASMSVSVHWP